MNWLRAIAICSAARGVALQELSVETPLGSFPKIIQVKLVHQAFDRDADFCRVISRVNAISNGDDSDAGKPETLDDPVGVPHIPRETGELVDGNGLERARYGEGRSQRLLKA